MFIYNIQLPTDKHDTSHDFGSIDANTFFKKFDEFDWIKNIELANLIQECSPTLSVKNDIDKTVLWVSAYLNEELIQYIIGMVKKVEKSFLGIWKRESEEHRQCETQDPVQVKDLYALFFRREYEKIYEVLK